MRWLDSTTNTMYMSLQKLQEIVKDRGRSLVCCSPWDRRVGHNLVTDQQQYCPSALMLRLSVYFELYF